MEPAWHDLPTCPQVRQDRNLGWVFSKDQATAFRLPPLVCLRHRSPGGSQSPSWLPSEHLVTGKTAFGEYLAARMLQPLSHLVGFSIGEGRKHVKTLGRLIKSIKKQLGNKSHPPPSAPIDWFTVHPSPWCLFQAAQCSPSFLHERRWWKEKDIQYRHEAATNTLACPLD